MYKLEYEALKTNAKWSSRIMTESLTELNRSTISFLKFNVYLDKTSLRPR